MHLNAILPPEAIWGTGRIILTGSSHVLIESHDGLLSYDDKCIKLRFKDHTLSVCGTSLIISSFSKDTLIIKGQIRTMEFLA